MFCESLLIDNSVSEYYGNVPLWRAATSTELFRRRERDFRIAMEGIVLNWRQFSITSVKQLTRYWCVFGMFLVSFWKL